LPSIATLSKYLTITAVLPFSLNSEFVDKERRADATGHLAREQLPAARREAGSQLARRARAGPLIDREREVHRGLAAGREGVDVDEALAPAQRSLKAESLRQEPLRSAFSLRVAVDDRQARGNRSRPRFD